MPETNGTTKLLREVNWSIIVQLLTFIFLAGFAYATLETRKDHTQDINDLRKENTVLYMPRELSLEKWRINDESHARLEKLAAEIRDELRRANAQRAR